MSAYHMNKNYSAGAMSKSFWFPEFRQVVDLLDQGKSITEIKSINDQENLFGANSTRRSKEIMNTIASRVKLVDQSFITLFLESDLQTQKILYLLTCLLEDRLFFEFVNETVKKNIFLDQKSITYKDINRFFDNKRLENEKVAGWIDSTYQKLGNAYINYLYNAGVLIKDKNQSVITKPMISNAAREWIEQKGLDPVYSTLTGENR